MACGGTARHVGPRQGHTRAQQMDSSGQGCEGKAIVRVKGKALIGVYVCGGHNTTCRLMPCTTRSTCGYPCLGRGVMAIPAAPIRQPTATCPLLSPPRCAPNCAPSLSSEHPAPPSTPNDSFGPNTAWSTPPPLPPLYPQ